MTLPGHELDPCKAPWPPGVDFRLIVRNGLLIHFQLRPGAALPPPAYLSLMCHTLSRAEAAHPCRN